MIGLKWSTYLRSMAINTAKSIAVGALVYVAYLIGISTGTGNIALLALMIVVGIISFTGIAFAFNREYLRELRDLITPGTGE
jgi:hypothetical protein